MAALRTSDLAEFNAIGYDKLHSIMAGKEQGDFANIVKIKKEKAPDDSVSNWILNTLNTFSQTEALDFMVQKFLEVTSEKEELKEMVNKLQKDNIYLKKKSNLCSLTKVLNRNFLEEHIAEIDKRKENDENYAKDFYFFFLDLNKFKPINDQYGHEVGDKVLIELSKRLSKFVRNGDLATSDISESLKHNFIARVGGDEFVAKIKLSNEKEADFIKKRLEFEVSKPIFTDVGKMKVGVSIGYQKMEKNKKACEILAMADKNMYESKRK